MQLKSEFAILGYVLGKIFLRKTKILASSFPNMGQILYFLHQEKVIVYTDEWEKDYSSMCGYYEDLHLIWRKLDVLGQIFP